jgi:hypothetical protein
MSTPFQTALVAGDLAGLRACPKADLHVHGIGGGSRVYLRKRTGRDIAPFEGVFASMAEMDAWTQTHLGDLFKGASGRAIAFEATMAQARLDGVTRIEVGEDVWGVTLHDEGAPAVWRRCSGFPRWGCHATARSALWSTGWPRCWTSGCSKPWTCPVTNSLSR